MNQKIIIGIVLGIVALFYWFNKPDSLKGTPPGLPADYASSTQYALTDAPILVTGTTTCAARIVTSGVGSISLAFNDNVLAGNPGHQQAASTTVSYDGSIYGCGRMRVRGNVTPAGTITITETR